MFASVPQIPIDLHDKEFLPILQEEPLPPLALVSFTEEEQVGAVALAPKKKEQSQPVNLRPEKDGSHGLSPVGPVGVSQ